MSLINRPYMYTLCSKPYLAATVVLTAAALAMTQMPLVDDLGFEICRPDRLHRHLRHGFHDHPSVAWMAI